MDPLSITAGAAGFICLGVTVCDGLVAYCRAYKSRDDDILLLNQHSERLQQFLCMVQDRMQSGSQVDLTLKDAVQICINASADCVLEFGKLTAKWQLRPHTGGFKASSQVIADHLRYPSQKRDTYNLKAQLNELHRSLCSYMLLLN